MTAPGHHFRAELLALLDDHESRALRATAAEDPRPVYRRLGAAGLLAPHWPPEHGGRGLTLDEAAIVVEELVRLGVPDTLYVLSIQIVGQFILAAGTRAQRSTLLGPLARGERFATVLYTEPDAGSDIASVATTARPAGDGRHRITGTKVYNPWTAQADVALCLARTEPARGRYRDLTLFLVPLTAAGLQARPLPTIGPEHLHEVVLDGVEVGPDAVVGEVGGAWALMDTALALERTGIEYAARAVRWLEVALRAAVEDGRANGRWLEELGRLGAEADAARRLAWRVVERLREGEPDGIAAAGSKWYTSRAAQRVAWWAAETLAAAPHLGALGPEAASDAATLRLAHAEAPGLTLSAGTSEMVLQVVAGGLAGGAGAGVTASDPLARQLQRAVRSVLLGASPASSAGDAGPPDHRGVWTDLAELGLFALAVPAELGGLGLGQRAATAACSELGRALEQGLCRDTLLAVDCLVADGSEGRRTLLADLAGGRLSACALRWPGAEGAADAAAVSPFAAGAGLLLDWLPAGAAAQVRVVPARRAGWDVPEASAWPWPEVAHRGAPAPRTGDRVDLDTAAAALVTARVRCRQAAYLCGLARAAHELAVARAAERRQFGRPIVDFQAVGLPLAALAVRLDTADLLVWRAAGLDDAGHPSPIAAAEALGHAAELALDVTRTAMQVHGAGGITLASPVQRFYRAAVVEAVRLGHLVALWRAAGRMRLEAALRRGDAWTWDAWPAGVAAGP